MNEDLNVTVKTLINQIKFLTKGGGGSDAFYEAAGLSLAVLNDTVGESHPLCKVLDDALRNQKWSLALASSRGVVTLFEKGGLKNPRLSIAHEIDDDFLDVAQKQAHEAKNTSDLNQKHLRLAIAAFIAGASLEDALRRLCDANGLTYEVGKTTISKLQAILYQPAKRIEIISSSEHKQITAWGDTRNKADHGNFMDIALVEVETMLMGVRAFLEKHLP